MHDYVNLYIQPYNAFMVAIQNTVSRDDLCTIRIKSEVLEDKKDEAVVTTKNAACHRAKFFAPRDWAPSPDTTKALTTPLLSGLDSKQWAGPYFHNRKQSRQSEVLLPNEIDSSYFDAILVYNESVKKRVLAIVAASGLHIPVIVHTSLFVSPKKGAFSKELQQTPDPKNPIGLFLRSTSSQKAALSNESYRSPAPKSRAGLFSDASNTDRSSENNIPGTRSSERLRNKRHSMAMAMKTKESFLSPDSKHSRGLFSTNPSRGALSKRSERDENPSSDSMRKRPKTGP